MWTLLLWHQLFEISWATSVRICAERSDVRCAYLLVVQSLFPCREAGFLAESWIWYVPFCFPLCSYVWDLSRTMEESLRSISIHLPREAVGTEKVVVPWSCRGFLLVNLCSALCVVSCQDFFLGRTYTTHILPMLSLSLCMSCVYIYILIESYRYIYICKFILSFLIICFDMFWINCNFLILFGLKSFCLPQLTDWGAYHTQDNANTDPAGKFLIRNYFDGSLQVAFWERSGQERIWQVVFVDGPPNAGQPGHCGEGNHCTLSFKRQGWKPVVAWTCTMYGTVYRRIFR